MHLFRVPTFACRSLCNSWSVYTVPGRVSVIGRTELGCTWPLTLSGFLSSLPHSVYLPLSHRLCGRRCLLPGYRLEWTGHNHDSNVDWTWPHFPSLPRPTSVWVAVWGQASACQMESTKTDRTNSRQKGFTSWLSLCYIHSTQSLNVDKFKLEYMYFYKIT